MLIEAILQLIHAHGEHVESHAMNHQGVNYNVEQVFSPLCMRGRGIEAGEGIVDVPANFCDVGARDCALQMNVCGREAGLAGST